MSACCGPTGQFARALLPLAVIFFAVMSGSLVCAATSHQTSDQYGVVLSFDLTDERHPAGTLVINRNPSQGESQNIVLPFAVTGVGTDEAALIRVGAYQGWSLISYSPGSASFPQYAAFHPVVDAPPPDFDGDRDGLDGGVYLQNNGQFHHFYYRYPEAWRGYRKISARLPIKPVDAVQIFLPDGWQPRSINEDRDFETPQRLADRETKSDLIFPGAMPTGGPKFLEIAYETPPTVADLLLAKYGILYVGVLMSGLASVVFVKRSDIKRQRLKFWSGIVLGAGAFALIGVLIYFDWADKLQWSLDLGAAAALFLVAAAVYFITGADQAVPASGRAGQPHVP